MKILLLIIGFFSWLATGFFSYIAVETRVRGNDITAKKLPEMVIVTISGPIGFIAGVAITLEHVVSRDTVIFKAKGKDK